MDIEAATSPVDGEDNAAATLPDDSGVEQEALTPQLDEFGEPIVAEPEEEEIEVDPELKLKVPKDQAQKLKDAILRQADYTRKTQEVAEMKRATGETLQQLQSMNNQEFTARATLMNVDQQLAQYQNVDFQAAMNQAAANYDEEAKANIQAAFMKFTQLKDLRGQALGIIGQAQGARQSFEQQETAKLIDQGRTELKKHVPEWNDDLKAKLVNFAASYGVGADELSDLEANPGAARILHAAFKGASAATQQKTAATIAAVQAVKPAAKVGGGAPPPSGLNDSLSTEEWVRRRDAQTARRGR